MMLGKFRATLYGVLVGDCFGALFQEPEILSKGSRLLLRKFLDGLEKEAKVIGLRKSYTDDTALTLAVCRTLTACRRIEQKNLAVNFVDEFSKNMHRGYSVSTIEVLARLKHANFEDVSYPAKEVMTGETGDNGCAMYVAPIALWCANKTELNLNDQVREASALTHFHEMAVLGALLQANAMRLLLTNDGHLNVDYFLDEIIDSAGLQKSVSTGPSFVHQMQQMRKLLNVSNPSEERVVDVLGHSSQAMYSVPTAIYCFLRGVRHPNETNPFRDAIEYAITLGGHSNTITSMTGALCGAYYGESVISPNMLIQCEGFNEITEISQELYKNSEKVR